MTYLHILSSFSSSNIKHICPLLVESTIEVITPFDDSFPPPFASKIVSDNKKFLLPSIWSTWVSWAKHFVKLGWSHLITYILWTWWLVPSKNDPSLISIQVVFFWEMPSPFSLGFSLNFHIKCENKISIYKQNPLINWKAGSNMDIRISTSF